MKNNGSFNALFLPSSIYGIDALIKKEKRRQKINLIIRIAISFGASVIMTYAFKLLIIDTMAVIAR